jgi:hypothetical protein
MQDPITGATIPDVAVSSRSVWDQHLEQRGLFPKFALNTLNYDSISDVLLPRAVGYSAGLLDYFFRGTLDFDVKVGTGQDGQMGLVITNTSAEAMDGVFALYAEDAEGNRGDSPEVSITLPLPPGGESPTVSFTPVRSVRKYVLVFQGTLGLEAGAVAGRVKPYELPPAIPVQERASFTGEEQVASFQSGPPGTYVNSGMTRYRPGTQQRAQGVFFPAYLGKRLRRVELLFDIPPAPGQVVLKLNGTAVGTAWAKEAQPEIEPLSWEVVLDVPSHTQFPRYLVAEAESGERLTMPFLWWKSASSAKTHAMERQYCGTIEACMLADYRVSSVVVEVKFGDRQNGYDSSPPLTEPHTAVGFIPLTGIAGYPVGSYEDTQVPTIYPVCVAGPFVGRGVEVFTYAGTWWNKNRAGVSIVEGQGTPGLCSEMTLPESLPVEPAPPIPPLQFQRDYLPAEQARFQELGLVPPTPGVIELN